MTTRQQSESGKLMLNRVKEKEIKLESCFVELEALLKEQNKQVLSTFGVSITLKTHVNLLKIIINVRHILRTLKILQKNQI